MDALRALCLTPGSRLGTVARSQLSGLHTALSELIDVWPDDTGADQCRAALRELDTLLASGTGLPGAARNTGPVRVPAAQPVSAAPAADGELLALAGELTKSPEAADYLGPLRLPGSPDAGADTPALWLWFHTTLLRLPAAYAATWRDRTRSLAVVAAGPADEQWIEWWARDREQVLVPPMPAFGVPGVRLNAHGNKAGWALAAAEVEGARRMPGADSCSTMDVWVELAGWVAGMAGLDDRLNHCLENLTHRGVLPLHAQEHRSAYRQETSHRITRLARAPQDSPAELRAALAMDEALCSVIHLPPAAPGSWWAEVAEASQRAVLGLRRRVQGSGVEAAVEVLAPSSYRDARQRTGGNDIPLDAGGRKGQVLAGLRLWARIDGRELPGRVVYRG